MAALALAGKLRANQLVPLAVELLRFVPYDHANVSRPDQHQWVAPLGQGHSVVTESQATLPLVDYSEPQDSVIPGSQGSNHRACDFAFQFCHPHCYLAYRYPHQVRHDPDVATESVDPHCFLCPVLWS